MTNALPWVTVISGAISFIFPSTKRISQSSNFPFGPQVQIVALSIKIAFGAISSPDKPYAPSGKKSGASLATSGVRGFCSFFLIRFALIG